MSLDASPQVKKRIPISIDRMISFDEEQSKNASKKIIGAMSPIMLKFDSFQRSEENMAEYTPQNKLRPN
jgi:hypothetical protein